MSWRILAVLAIVAFAVAAVVGLTLAGKDPSSVAYLLVAIIPSTVASVLAVRTGNQNSVKLDVVTDQTNGPISAIATQVRQIHTATDGPVERMEAQVAQVHEALGLKVLAPGVEGDTVEPH